MSYALELHAIRKRYGRRGPWALDGLSCRFPRGAICGFVGPNGAGKTTAFSVVCGYLPPDSGTINILGTGSFDPWRLKGRLGVLPQDAGLGGRHSPNELLVHLGELQGLRRKDSERSTAEVLDHLGLRERANDRIGTLSHGMQRRVAVASALIGRPELVLLDEPTAGLDPTQARGLRELLLRRSGATTLIVSSHNLDELERTCDYVVMLDKGRCLAQGTLAEVTGRGDVVRWLLGPGDVPMARLSEALPGYRLELERRGEEQALTQHSPANADLDAASLVIAQALIDAGIPIRRLQRGRGLEESFLDLHGGGGS